MLKRFKVRMHGDVFQYGPEATKSVNAEINVEDGDDEGIIGDKLYSLMAKYGDCPDDLEFEEYEPTKDEKPASEEVVWLAK